MRFIPAAIIISMLVYCLIRLYHSIWRYAGISEAYRIFSANIILAVINFIPAIRISRGVLFIGGFISFFFCTALQFGYRIARSLYTSFPGKKERRLKSQKQYRVRAIIDDNPNTHSKYLEGIRIEGDRNDIKELADKFDIDLIVFAIPSASFQDRKDILNICKETGCYLQIIPGLVQILTGEESTTRLRDVSTDDLLERDEIKVNTDVITRSIWDKVIMVTGGRGSIGSEMCRQELSIWTRQAKRRLTI